MKLVTPIDCECLVIIIDTAFYYSQSSGGDEMIELINFLTGLAGDPSLKPQDQGQSSRYSTLHKAFRRQTSARAQRQRYLDFECEECPDCGAAIHAPIIHGTHQAYLD